jgi:hypothetical protein
MQVSDREWAQINKAIKDYDCQTITLKFEVDSPWLQIDLWTWDQGEMKMAMWRYTGVIHHMDRHGAVIEEPLAADGW